MSKITEEEAELLYARADSPPELDEVDRSKSPKNPISVGEYYIVTIEEMDKEGQKQIFCFNLCQ